MLRKGDVLFSRSGTIGRCTTVEIDGEATFAAYLVRFRPMKDRVEPRYIHWWVQSQSYWDQVRLDTIESTIGNFNAAKFSNLRLPSIEREAQKAIADFLDRETARIDQLIEKKQRSIELVDEKRGALIAAAVTGRIDCGLRDDQSVNNVDRRFPEVPIGAAFDVRNGATPASVKPAYWHGDVAWITPDDLGKLESRFIHKGARNITRAGYLSCGTQMVPAGTVILSSRAPIGHLAIASRAMCFNQGCRGLIPRSIVSTNFAFWALLAHKPKLEAAGQGSTFVELGRDKLRAERIPLPDANTQREISAFLDRETARIDALKAKTQSSIDRLRELRASLITAAVTGQIDVATWGKEGQVGRDLDQVEAATQA